MAARLTKSGISALPVCDREGHVLGIINVGDLMRPFGQAHDLCCDWRLGLLAEGNELAPVFLDYIRKDKRIVRDLMTRPAHSATEDMTIPQATDSIIRYRIKRLPVVQDGKLVGIMSRADLVRAIYEQKRSIAAAATSSLTMRGAEHDGG